MLECSTTSGLSGKLSFQSAPLPPSCPFSLLKTLHTADSLVERKDITLMTALSFECTSAPLQQPELTFRFIRDKKENGDVSESLQSRCIDGLQYSRCLNRAKSSRTKELRGLSRITISSCPTRLPGRSKGRTRLDSELNAF